MANTLPQRKIIVPKNADDPIQYLLDEGYSVPELAIRWDLRAADSVYRLKRFEYVPRYKTAIKMAKTLGWSSAGEVMDRWAARVES